MTQHDALAVLSSLVVGELSQARRVSALDPVFLDLGPHTEIGRGDLATDSLDLMTLAGAVTEMFHLWETGVEEYLLRYRKLENWAEIVAASLARKAERITFRSGGSTGTPKRCTHSFPELLREAAEHATKLTGCKRVVSMVPAHHIYGFIWTALLPAQLGVECIDARRWMPLRLASDLRPGDLVVGVPAEWQRLCQYLDSVPQGVCGVSSGARCPDAVFRQLRQRMRLIEVYGSSETAGIGARESEADPFHLLDRWALAGAELVQRQDPKAAPVQPPDHLTWITQRSFQVGRRTDGALQVNGRNVFPEHVARVIRSHPGIQDCAVRPTTAGEDSRLKAFIVPHHPDGPGAPELQRWLRDQLQPWEMPVAFRFGNSIPLNDMGKRCDWEAVDEVLEAP